jgi:hypothetical protein
MPAYGYYPRGSKIIHELQPHMHRMNALIDAGIVPKALAAKRPL